MLLKATHLPFIGAIWAYEHLAGRKHSAGGVSIGGPETPSTIKRPPRSSMNPPRPLTSGFQAATEGNGSTPGRFSSANRPQTRGGPSESDPQLKSLVLKLTAQVEQLTAVVSQLQEQREASMAA